MSTAYSGVFASADSEEGHLLAVNTQQLRSQCGLSNNALVKGTQRRVTPLHPLTRRPSISITR